MSALDAVVEELKSLPPASLEAAADYIHQLKLASIDERRRALQETFGCLTREDADDMDRAIAANCERVDATQW